MELSKICKYTTSRIDSASLNVDNYISTENMMQNKGGVVAASKAPSEKAVEFRPGDILVSNIRPYFKKIWLADRSGGCSSDVLCIRALEGTDNVYLYYLLSQDSFFDYVMSGAKGSKMPRGDKNQIMKWEVDLPDIDEQKRIGQMLKSIDDKILLNTRINHNLEVQIHLLYNQWFEESNARYTEVPLSELIDFQEGPGIRNWQYVESNGVKFINIRCINGGDVDVSSANMISKEEAFGKYNHFQLNEMDIVMSCSGTLGRYAIIRKEHLPLCLNTSVIRFKPRISPADYSFVYGYLSSDEFMNTQRDLACGSVQANFGPSHLKSMSIKSYAADYRSAFNEIVFPMIQTSCMIKRENDKLKNERDYLLPILMKGTLAINETID